MIYIFVFLTLDFRVVLLKSQMNGYITNQVSSHLTTTQKMATRKSFISTPRKEDLEQQSVGQFSMNQVPRGKKSLRIMRRVTPLMCQRRIIPTANIINILSMSSPQTGRSAPSWIKSEPRQTQRRDFSISVLSRLWPH